MCVLSHIMSLQGVPWEPRPVAVVILTPPLLLAFLCCFCHVVTWEVSPSFEAFDAPRKPGTGAGDQGLQKDAFPTFTRFSFRFFLEEHLKFNVVRVAGVPRLSLLQSLGVLGFPAFSFSPSVHRTLTRPYAHLLLIIQM